MSYAIFSGFMAWKFDRHSAQNVGYVVVVVVVVGVVVDAVFSFCAFGLAVISLLREIT